MGAITPQFVVDLETRMQVITETEYARLNSNLWWRNIAKVRPSTGKKDILTWLLSTAMIRDQGEGGNIRFDDLVAQYTTIENKWSGAGLKLRIDQLTDTDGGGMDLAAQWSSDIGAYMSYWPQKGVAHLLMNGHTASLYTSYDGKAFFATDHPINPYRSSAGTYRNIFTGGASGTYPGACPIDDSVTLDVALVNLGKMLGYIAQIKMPNGEDPRFLRPKALIVSPRLFPRAVQLTSAKFLAQAAASGGGSADVEALIKALGFATPYMADELAGWESDTSFIIVCEQVAASQLGGVLYIDREPFRINYYGLIQDAELNRKDELEWHCKGRNVVAPGHPYMVFKGKGS